MKQPEGEGSDGADEESKGDPLVPFAGAEEVFCETAPGYCYSVVALDVLA